MRVEDPITIKMVFRLRADDGPTFNAGLIGSFVDFVIFPGRWGVLTPVPPLNLRMFSMVKVNPQSLALQA